MCEKSPGGGLSTCTYGEVSPIFWVRILPKVIFLGPNKTKTIFMIFFDTKHRLTDISGFARGNSDSCLHCFRLFMFIYMFQSIRDQSLLMVGGGAEDIKGGSPILFLPRWGGPDKKSDSERGGHEKYSVKIDKYLIQK